MTTTTTSDGDLAVGRDLFQGEDTAFARAGVFGEDELKRLIAIFPNASSVFEATKAGKSLEDLLQEPRTVDSSTRPPTEELGRVRKNLRITGKEIQVMAGARFASAINNWRNGKKSFPEPVVGGRSPLFDLTEVHTWLKGNDKLVNEPGADWYWRKWVQVLHRSVEQRGRFLRGYVTAMVFVLPDFPTEKDGWDDRLRDIHTPQGFDQWSAGKENIGEFVGFLRKHLLGMGFTGSEGSPMTSVARAFWYAFKNGFKERDLLDQALDTLTELSDTQDNTALPLSDLITRLVADLPGPPSSFLDLACGEATVLTNLINRGGLPDLKLSGFELEHETAAISMIRLGYHDNGADWDIQVRDSLAEGDSQTTGRPQGAFDAVLVDPPTKQFPRWTNRATALLNKTTASRAFVLLPESALAADGPCAGSIRRKQLEAVVCLPNRLKRKSRGLVLCVFTSDQAACEEILIVDLKRKDPDSETGTKPPGRIGDVLPAGDVCAAISHWRDTQTINEELLPGRQWSIRSSEATERGIGPAALPVAPVGDPNTALTPEAHPPTPSFLIPQIRNRAIIRRGFLAAVSDLIDRSLEADATVINAQVGFSTNPDGEPVPRVAIADNGVGMGVDELVELLRFGWSTKAAPSYGFGHDPQQGLLMASIGFCRGLSVVSTPGSGAPVNACTLDLDRMIHEDKWKILLRESDPGQSDAFRKACETLSKLSGEATDHGTLVIWDKVDPLSKASVGRRLRSQDHHLALLEDLRVFLEMLYSDDDGVIVAVNGESVSSGRTTNVLADLSYLTPVRTAQVATPSQRE